MTDGMMREFDALTAKAALLDEMTAACEMVLKRWSFHSQQHTHTWHDMQDCRAVIVPLLAKANKVAGGL